MKFKIFLLFMTVGLLQAQTPTSPEPGSPWVAMAKHNDELLQAIKKQDTHQIHELSEGLQDEAGGLASKGNGLSVEQQTQFQAALKEISADAGAIHKAAHRSAWEEALSKQEKLTEAIQKITTMMSGK